MQDSETYREPRFGDSTYVFENASSQAPARFAALSAMFDPGTIRHLEDRGVGRGWHCLEVGGGNGSIAAWLADRVGPTGHVLVTDIDPRFLETMKLPNLEVRRHNIVNDSLPEGAFDLVHARLVLIHLPERDKVLQRMVAALKPGGWLVDEEFDSVSLPPDPTVSSGEVRLKIQGAIARFMADRGVESRLGRLLFGRLRTQGLVAVCAEARMFMWHRGSLGASLIRANYEQLRRAMIDAGYITEQEFNEDMAQLDHPDFMMPSAIMWAAWGSRPSK
jgi:SAM-dependent methyltransferase